MQPFFLLTAHWRRNFRLRWKMGRRKFFNRALYFCNIWTRVDNSDIDGMYGWLSWFQDSVGCEFTFSFSTYNAHTRLGFQNCFSHRRGPCKSTCPPPSTSPWSLSLSLPEWGPFRKKCHMHKSQFILKALQSVHFICITVRFPNELYLESALCQTITFHNQMSTLL